MTEKEFIKLANKILYVKQSARTPFGGKKSELKGLEKLYKAINYIPFCKSDSEQLLAYTEFLRKELHLNISDTWVEGYIQNSK